MYNKSDVILEVKNISKEFKTSKNKIIKACDNINFKVLRGKTVGIVGESGCGKSTLARILIQLEEASYGEVIYNEDNILLFSEKKKRDNRKKIQMIFQDSLYSFNPKMKVIDILTEPLLNFKIINKKEKEEKAIKLLEMVELSSEILYRYPHNLSGGQRQRIGIARALSLEPEILICDESTSALDVSVQNKIIKLLVKLQKEKNISIIFICHDIALIKSFSHEIIVMYLGNIVEKIPSSKINTNSKHPYTNMLLESVFLLDIENSKNIDSNENEVVNISYSEEGCVFKNRCKYCKDICKIEKPKLKEVEENHKVACHLF